MANDPSVYIPKLIAKTLPVLRENAQTARLVNTGYSLSPQEKGSSVTIPKSVAITAGNATPSNTPPAVTDVTPTSVSITLDQWKDADFHLTDQEITRIQADDDFIPMQLAECVKALVNTIDAAILGQYVDVYEYAGTAGTTPFASNVTAWTTGARARLNANLAPLSQRAVMLDVDAEANAIGLQAFQDQSWRGDGAGILEAQIGRKLGADWFMNQNIPTHTAGTLTGSPLINNASVSVGDTTVDMDAGSLTGTIVAGDVFTVAGDTQHYVVTAGQTASGNALTAVAFSPAAKVAWADNAAVTFVADHVVNLAFNRDAFGLAFAPLPIEDGNPNMAYISDPVTGISLRLEKVREWKQTVFNLDVLYGVECIRPELACRIAG